LYNFYQKRKYSCPVELNKLFLATHMKKSGGWVDGFSRDTNIIV